MPCILFHISSWCVVLGTHGNSCWFAVHPVFSTPSILSIPLRYNFQHSAQYIKTATVSWYHLTLLKILAFPLFWPTEYQIPFSSSTCQIPQQVNWATVPYSRKQQSQNVPIIWLHPVSYSFSGFPHTGLRHNAHLSPLHFTALHCTLPFPVVYPHLNNHPWLTDNSNHTRT